MARPQEAVKKAVTAKRLAIGSVPRPMTCTARKSGNQSLWRHRQRCRRMCRLKAHGVDGFGPSGNPPCPSSSQAPTRRPLAIHSWQGPCSARPRPAEAECTAERRSSRFAWCKDTTRTHSGLLACTGLKNTITRLAHGSHSHHDLSGLRAAFAPPAIANKLISIMSCFA